MREDVTIVQDVLVGFDREEFSRLDVDLEGDPLITFAVLQEFSLVRVKGQEVNNFKRSKFNHK